MRSVLAFGAFALFAVGVSGPASAQMMCGPGQQAQAQATTPAPPGGMGGMCGMGAVEDDPMADKPKTPPQRMGMCACCGQMAMMRDGMMGGQPAPAQPNPPPAPAPQH